jgi:hypothetical protein
MTTGSGTAADPWARQTPPLGADLQAWREGDVLLVHIGTTKLSYQARAIGDLHAMLVAHGGWMPRGTADEGKPVAGGSVGAWARARPA